MEVSPGFQFHGEPKLQLTPLLPIYFVTVGVTLLVALQTWQRRRTPGARQLTFLMVAAAIWAFADGMALASLDLQSKIAFSKVSHIGIQTVPVFFLLFVLSYTGHDKVLHSRWLHLIWVIPLLSLLAVFTNERHSLFWENVSLVQTSYGIEDDYIHGPLFWVSAANLYVLILVATVLLVRNAVSSVHQFRLQTVMILTATAIPWAANFVYLFDLIPWPWLDLTSVAFAASGVLLAWAILRLGLLRIVPVARAQLVERMSEGMVVIDTRGHIIDLNPAAASLLQIEHVSIGGPLYAAGEGGALLARNVGVACKEGACAEVLLPNGTTVEVRCSSLSALHGRLQGTLLVLHDITDRKRIETELRSSEERYRTLYTKTPAMLHSIDRKGRIISVTDFWLDQMGYGRSDVVGHQSTEFMTEVSERYAREQGLAEFFRAGIVSEVPYEFVRRDGTVIETLLSAVAERSLDGQVVRSLSVLQDVTERNRVWRSLQASEARYRTLIDAAPFPAVVTAVATGRILYSNAMGKELFDIADVPLDSLLADNFYLHAGERRRLLARLASDQRITNAEVEMRTAKGRALWVLLSAVPIEFDGEAAVFSIFNDITDRRSIEERLRDSERRYRLLAENVSDVIWMLDFDQHVVYCSPSIFGLTGFSAEEAMQAKATDFVVPASQPRFVEVLHELTDALANGIQSPTVTLEIEVPCKDGSAVWTDTSVKLMYDGAQAIGFLGITRDISVRRAAEAAMRAARDAAEAATQAKSEFLANMSHEIRTPMNAVIGMTSLLLGTQLTPEQREFTETVRNSSEALLAIINDILDFSKIESGKLELERHSFDVALCMESALDLVAMQASRKGLELTYAVTGDLSAHVVGDDTRLRQVLVNLLTNAIKFTDRGEVNLRLAVQPSATADDPRGCCNPSDAPCRLDLHFEVQDTGLGIPKDRQQRLFSSFSQVDTSTTRRFGGTGLGLAISRRLVELMGGSIWLESDGVAGHGTTFHVRLTLPCTTMPVQADSQPGAADLTGKRILIVDDNDTNQRILLHQLRQWGIVCQAVGSAQAAIETMVGESAFDVVLLDLQMPAVDGIGLATEIRRRWPDATPRLILLTSMDYDAGEVARAGVSTYLYKPIKPAALFDVLRQAGNQPRTATGDNGATKWDASLAERRPLRILAAEDNLVNQKVIQTLLGRFGYRVDLVNDGVQAVEAVRRQFYDVVLMDVQMPEMDGVEATITIRSELPPERQPYIIAMTANAFDDQRRLYLESGMNDYVSKPVRPAMLLAALDRVPERVAHE
mgnify:CR=1 FL=1